MSIDLTIHRTADRGNVHALEAAIRKNPHLIDVPDYINNRTPLWLAVFSGHVLAVESLIRLGSKDIDISDNIEWTLLNWAENRKHASMVNTLKILGAKYYSTTYYTHPGLTMINKPIDEEESMELRYRVYFRRSLTARLLFLSTF